MQTHGSEKVEIGDEAKATAERLQAAIDNASPALREAIETLMPSMEAYERAQLALRPGVRHFAGTRNTVTANAPATVSSSAG